MIQQVFGMIFMLNVRSRLTFEWSNANMWPKPDSTGCILISGGINLGEHIIRKQ